MGVMGFAIWFITGLVGTFMLNVIFSNNPFIPAMIVALVMGILGATRE